MIVFDFCGVLGDDPTDQNRRLLERRAGRRGEGFWTDYWSHRRAYDLGELTDRDYWAQVAPEATDITGLVEADVAGWLRLRPGVLELVRQLPGPKAILSNAPLALAAAIDLSPWARLFTRRVFSADIGAVKPDAEAFRILCEQVRRPTGEIVVVDDRIENVAAARAVGMRGIQFTDLRALRAALR